MNLYVLDVRWLYEENAFSNMLDFVDENRRVKALCYRFAKDRALSLGAGLLLNFALGREAPALPWPPRIRFDEYGKPFLAETGAPEFNLSHAGVYAVCAIDSEQVGVDIEKVDTNDESVARRCFVAGELPRVMPGGRINAEAFCRLWALKESYAKFTGAGLLLDPLRIEIIDAQPMRVRQDGVEKTCCLTLYEGLTDYKLALCARTNRPAERAEIVAAETLRAAVRRIPPSALFNGGTAIETLL